MLILGLYLITVAARAIASGKIRHGFTIYDKNEAGFTFWMFVSSCAIVGVVCVLFSLGVLWGVMLV